MMQLCKKKIRISKKAATDVISFFSFILPDHAQGPGTVVMRTRTFRNVTSALIFFRPPVTLLCKRVNSAAWTARWRHKHGHTHF